MVHLQIRCNVKKEKKKNTKHIFNKQWNCGDLVCVKRVWVITTLLNPLAIPNNAKAQLTFSKWVQSLHSSKCDFRAFKTHFTFVWCRLFFRINEKNSSGLLFQCLSSLALNVLSDLIHLAHNYRKIMKSMSESYLVILGLHDITLHSNCSLSVQHLGPSISIIGKSF